MNLFKATFLSAIETAIKLISGFILIRYIAIQTGPKGIAYLGQFQTFFAGFLIVLSGGFNIGLVRFSAEEKKNNFNKNYLGNAISIGIFLSILVPLLLILFANKIAFSIFNSPDFVGVFYQLALGCSFIVFYQVIIAVLNGWGELNKLIVCKISCSLLLLISSVITVHLYGIYGALLSIVWMQVLASLIALVVFVHLNNFKWSWLKPVINFQIFKDFSSYWSMSLVTLISSPFFLLLLRTYISHKINWESVGIWEASSKISEVYLLLITTSLTTYYIPKLSGSLEQDKQYIVMQVFKWAVSAAVIFALFVYFFREYIIVLLFSPDFMDAANLLKFQLLGSIIKIASWVFGYYILVTGKVTIFILSELVFGFTFYLLSIYFLNIYGLVGLSYAYFLNYSLYLAFCFLYCRREFVFSKKNILLNTTKI